MLESTTVTRSMKPMFGEVAAAVDVKVTMYLVPVAAPPPSTMKGVVVFGGAAEPALGGSSAPVHMASNSVFPEPRSFDRVARAPASSENASAWKRPGWESVMVNVQLRPAA